MFTKQDFERLKELFATKDDLKGIKQEIKEEIKEEIIIFKDEILHEIVAFREEMAVIIGYSDRIENHDQRIEKLEKVVLH